MAFMCFSNIKIKAFIKRVWNKLNKCSILCQKYACSLYYALTEKLPNFKAKKN